MVKPSMQYFLTHSRSLKIASRYFASSERQSNKAFDPIGIPRLFCNSNARETEAELQPMEKDFTYFNYVSHQKERGGS